MKVIDEWIKYYHLLQIIEETSSQINADSIPNIFVQQYVTSSMAVSSRK